MVMSKYKAALIGCGNRSRMHVNSYIHLEDASLIACCDLIEERRKSHEQEFGIKSYSDAQVLCPYFQQVYPN